MLKKTLITGGCGFIGSHLANFLKCLGNEVKIVDTLNREGTRNRYSAWSGSKESVSFEQAAVQSWDVIIHAAAICGVDTFLNADAAKIDVLSEIAKGIQFVRRLHPEQYLIFFSSAEVYGLDALEAAESDPVWIDMNNPRSAYTLTKLCLEEYFQTWRARTLVIRPCTIVGAGQTGPGIMSNFIRAIKEEKPLKLYNGGTSQRSLCHIDDFINALMCLLNIKATGVFNIGNPFNLVTPRELVTILESFLHRRLAVEKINYPLESITSRRSVNITKLCSNTAFRPTIDLQEAVKLTLEGEGLL